MVDMSEAHIRLESRRWSEHECAAPEHEHEPARDGFLSPAVCQASGLSGHVALLSETFAA
jgi:hypothetical protein